MQSDYDETKAVARLPNLDIEIRHSRPWRDQVQRGAQAEGEILTITLRATPSFDAFFGALEAANPALFWMRTFETAWAPWLALAGARRSIR